MLIMKKFNTIVQESQYCYLESFPVSSSAEIFSQTTPKLWIHTLKIVLLVKIAQPSKYIPKYSCKTTICEKSLYSNLQEEQLNN